MSQLPSDDAPAAGPVWTYTVACLAALAILLMALASRGLWPWASLPALVGFVGVVSRWRLATPLLLVTVGLLVLLAAFLTVETGGILPRSRPFQLPDLLLCGALFVYAACHYRLLGLTVSIFPRELRRSVTEQARQQALGLPVRGRGPSPQFRSPLSVSANEIGLLLVSVPIWVLIGQGVWLWLGRQHTALNLSDDFYRLILLVWLLGFGLIVVLAVLAYVRRSLMTRDEAALYLQDVQWLETRAEQRLLNRWLLKARRRGRAKED
jgi:hypothetical protein